MVAGSRKRRRPDGRLASPPLAPSPLLTRNLQLLPVGLTQLPNDKRFVSRLKQDIDELLSAFSEAFLLLTFQGNALSQGNGPASTSTSLGGSLGERDETHPLASPFSIFAQLWERKGWHYTQFTFADHADSKRALSHAICRVLLQHLDPYVAERNRFVSDNTEAPHSISFADLRQLFKVIAVPFALYLLWSTQIYPTSGIGVKHCRPAMERIPIEQDYYDWLLELPNAILKHLQDERRTAASAQAITADLVEVLCRLAGQPLDEDEFDRTFAQTPNPAHDSRQQISSNSKRKKEPEDPHSALVMTLPDPVFDIIPASVHATRLPRTWPSVRVMSTLEANKEVGRAGKIVRILPHESDGPPRMGPSGALSSSDFSSNRQKAASSNTTGGATEGVREIVAGLSRGDVVRLKARQRLAMATADVSKLLGLVGSSTDLASEAVPESFEPSQLLAPTAQHKNAGSHPSKRARYEIETPTWIGSAKYSAKMKPWLEESSTPMKGSLQRASDSKKGYLASRTKIMPSSSGPASAHVEIEESATQTDFSDWVLQSFRQERQALSTDAQNMTSTAEDEPSSAVDLPSVGAEGTLSLEALYRLAAERTKTAAVERGETLKAATGRASRSTS